MTYFGARGETAAQMKRVLQLHGEPAALAASHESVLRSWASRSTAALDLRVANRLFGAAGLTLEDAFASLTRDRFLAPIERLDFAAAEASRARINRWVEEQTKERIKQLLLPRSITPDTRLVLVNALYFKGQWTRPFVPEATQSKSFLAEGTRKIDVPTMAMTAPYRYADVGDATLLELGYTSESSVVAGVTAGSGFSMVVLLPKRVDGLGALEGSIDADRLEGWFAHLKTERVEVALPRFKVELPESLSLARPLVDLGMTNAFDAARADFTGIAKGREPLFISDVFHKAFVAVDERGTEAAAATAVVTTRGGTRPQGEPKRFIADHPFLFLIRDSKTGMLLFVGRVVEPKEPSVEAAR
jgi:serpin B